MAASCSRPIERANIDLGIVHGCAQKFGRAFDLPRTRQKHKQAAALGSQRRVHCFRRRLFNPHAGVARSMKECDGKETTLGLDYGRAAKQARNSGGIERRRHDEKAQIGAQALLRIARNRKP
jgi:hypothetical protein